MLKYITSETTKWYFLREMANKHRQLWTGLVNNSSIPSSIIPPRILSLLTFSGIVRIHSLWHYPTFELPPAYFLFTASAFLRLGDHCLSLIHSSIHPPIHPFIYPIYPSIQPFIYLFLHSEDIFWMPTIDSQVEADYEHIVFEVSYNLQNRSQDK